MSLKLYSVLLLICVLFVSKESCEASHVFDVYRLFQFDQDSISYGSQKANINHLATSFSGIKDGKLNQLVVLFTLDEITPSIIKKTIERGAEGILVIVPKGANLNNSKEIEELQTEFFKNHYKIPIYFTFEDETLKTIYKNSVGATQFTFSNLDSGDRYQLVVSGTEPQLIKDINVVNFQGVIPAASTNEDTATPTIAIVTYYDSFGVAPGISGDSSATNVVALIELARLYSKLYSSPKTQGRYNLLFLLTGAGSVNFAGSKHWLSNADVRLLESVEFALCLDNIGSGDELYLHLSKVSKEENIQSYYQSFNQTAKQMNINTDFIQKKINISNNDIDWEHEQFSRKRIPAATLSKYQTPRHSLSKSNIFDDRSKINTAALERNIKFVAEVLAKQIYNYTKTDLEIFSGSMSPNVQFINSLLDTTSVDSRSVPHLEKNSPVLSGIFTSLKSYTTEASNQTFVLESEYSFYDGIKYNMNAYRVKNSFFDVILFFVIATYLIILYAVMKGPSALIKQLKDIFSGSSKKVYKKKEK